MSFADDIKPAIHRIRAIPGKLGLRPYTVAVQIKSLDSTYGLQGTETTVSTYNITEADGHPPKVRFLNDEELTLSGLGKGSIEVGPITPDASGAGNALSDILGGAAATTNIVQYIVTGPEFPSGAVFERKNVKTDRALHYLLTLSPVADS